MDKKMQRRILQIVNENKGIATWNDVRVALLVESGEGGNFLEKEKKKCQRFMLKCGQFLNLFKSLHSYANMLT